jgi:hypothetical protein
MLAPGCPEAGGAPSVEAAPAAPTCGAWPGAIIMVGGTLTEASLLGVVVVCGVELAVPPGDLF